MRMNEIELVKSYSGGVAMVRPLLRNSHYINGFVSYQRYARM